LGKYRRAGRFNIFRCNGDRRGCKEIADDKK
jgi:hypothetical protein